MKAIVFNPESVAPEIKEWVNPNPGPNEVVVQVYAAALNHRDLNITKPGVDVEFVYGSDASGKIVQIGENVRDWNIGDEVIVNSYISCLECENCLNGNHTYCAHGRVLGGVAWAGSFAEYVKVPATSILKKPKHLNFQESAAIPLSFGTAWRAMTTRANIKPGESVFIQGIGGGVSLYCMQIAIAMGCKVVVSSSSDEKLTKAKEMGAWEGINYKKEDVLERVNKLTDGHGFDVIVSSFGGSVPLSVEAAKVGGRIVQFAYLGKQLSTFDVDRIMGKQLSLLGTGDHTYHEFQQALNFIENTKLSPVVSDVYPFERFAEAFELMEKGSQFGKIIISIKE
jgi:zinc-binding alcohol dehydrogenase/oxidoreductase